MRVEFRVATSFRELGRVRKKLEKLVPTLIFGKSRIFAIFSRKNRENREKKHGNYRNISKIRKTAISETGENENFGKNRLTQGLSSQMGHTKKIFKKNLIRIQMKNKGKFDKKCKKKKNCDEEQKKELTHLFRHDAKTNEFLQRY
jgi:hypothetical protein